MHGWLSQTTLQGVGTNYLQLLQNKKLKFSEECKPKRLSWAAYNQENR
jgi:hypothetical protein